MKDLKVKLWCPTLNEFISNDNEHVVYDISEEGILIFGVYEQNGDYHDCEPLLFTGLKDKEGNEIYAGDIILTPNLNMVEVLFGQHSIRVKRWDKITEEYQFNGWIIKNHKLNYIDLLDDSICAGAIIGNIYLDPELLKS